MNDIIRVEVFQTQGDLVSLLSVRNNHDFRVERTYQLPCLHITTTESWSLHIHVQCPVHHPLRDQARYHPLAFGEVPKEGEHEVMRQGRPNPNFSRQVLVIG